MGTPLLASHRSPSGSASSRGPVTMTSPVSSLRRVGRQIDGGSRACPALNVAEAVQYRVAESSIARRPRGAMAPRGRSRRIPGRGSARRSRPDPGSADAGRVDQRARRKAGHAVGGGPRSDAPLPGDGEAVTAFVDTNVLVPHLTGD